MLMLYHHMTNDGVILQAVERHILAVAGELLAAVRHFADQHKVGINPGAAVLQAGAEAMGAANILRARSSSRLPTPAPAAHRQNG